MKTTQLYFLRFLFFASAFLIIMPTSYGQKNSPLKFGEPLPANAFVELAKLINPAVVNISTTTMPKGRRGYGRDPYFDMLQQFYGMQMLPQQARPQQSLGTGFIIREDGLIVTNNHVIDGADIINVQLSEKSSKIYEAKVIGTDERTDLALIKIQATEKLPVAQLGSSKDTEVGEWVAAFGNPFGQGHTVTKGIVSAKGRELGEINRFPMIQTDTPINPGNSGGPLVNLKGQVIGVNAAINAQAQGMGFAIPIDEVKTIIPQLEKDGRVKKGYLGVGLDELNPQAAMYLGLKETSGVLIVSVDRNGPASKAGIKPYDVVVEFNGKKIANVRDFIDAVADAQIGSKAQVRFFREGKSRQLAVAISNRPEAQRQQRPERPTQNYTQHKAPMDLGFSLANMNDQIKREFELSNEHGNHPVITVVQPGTKAEMAGLMPGDVLLEVNRQEIIDSEELSKFLKKGANTFRIARGDGFAIIMLDLK